MSGVFQCDCDVVLALHRDRLVENPHILPFPLVPILLRVLRIGLIHIQVFGIGRKNRQPPRPLLVMPNRNTRQVGLATANHVPAGRNQMHPVAQRRRGNRAVRVVDHERLPGERFGAVHYPVITALVL